MKLYLSALSCFIFSFALSQSKGDITGKLLDFESVNEPLILAEVSVKETGTKTYTDENGLFTFQNLNSGDYTLVFRFTGYETKEINTTVAENNKEEIKYYLKPTTITFDELISTLETSEKSNSSTSK